MTLLLAESSIIRSQGRKWIDASMESMGLAVAKQTGGASEGQEIQLVAASTVIPRFVHLVQALEFKCKVSLFYNCS